MYKCFRYTKLWNFIKHIPWIKININSYIIFLYFIYQRSKFSNQHILLYKWINPRKGFVTIHFDFIIIIRIVLDSCWACDCKYLFSGSVYRALQYCYSEEVNNKITTIWFLIFVFWKKWFEIRFSSFLIKSNPINVTKHYLGLQLKLKETFLKLSLTIKKEIWSR